MPTSRCRCYYVKALYAHTNLVMTVPPSRVSGELVRKQQCAVFGVPDDRLGEEVAAAVVLKSGAVTTAEDLRAHCGARLAKYKIPRYIWLLEESLPRNANGKFLKRQLRDELDLAEAT